MVHCPLAIVGADCRCALAFFPLENLDDLFVADTYIAFNVLAQNPAPFPARLAKYKRVEDMPSRSLDVSTFPPN